MMDLHRLAHLVLDSRMGIKARVTTVLTFLNNLNESWIGHGTLAWGSAITHHQRSLAVSGLEVRVRLGGDPVAVLVLVMI